MQVVQALRRGRVERRGGPRRGDDEGRPDHLLLMPFSQR